MFCFHFFFIENKTTTTKAHDLGIKQTGLEKNDATLKLNAYNACDIITQHGAHALKKAIPPFFVLV